MIQNSLLRYIYKSMAVLLLSYALIAGLIMPVPIVGDLGQTARNLFYHVPMWFTMYYMMALSFGFSVAYLKTSKQSHDSYASEAAKVGMFFGLLGLLTGIVWSRVTWGQLMSDSNPAAWWSWDPKQTGALTAILIYAAYFLLRSSIEDDQRRARLAAVYNVFAGASLIPLTLVVPRVLGGLHPGGSDGSPVFNNEDISNEFRLIFYPSIIGFILLAFWIFELRVRVRVLLDQNK